jgi:hypothetical protein
MSDEPGTQASEVTKPGEAATACPACATPRTAGDRFCETCGHDFEATRPPPPPPAPAWELLIEADREYHVRFATAGVAFPDHLGAECMALEAPELRIGRNDGGADAPQITGAGDDPALSRTHAVLRRQDDGGYAIEDLGSTNGTEVNGRQIPPREVIVLVHGDRLHVGAWTSMTIRSREA